MPGCSLAWRLRAHMMRDIQEVRYCYYFPHPTRLTPSHLPPGEGFMGEVSIENAGATIGRPLGADDIQPLRASNARPYIEK